MENKPKSLWALINGDKVDLTRQPPGARVKYAYDQSGNENHYYNVNDGGPAYQEPGTYTYQGWTNPHPMMGMNSWTDGGPANNYSNRLFQDVTLGAKGPFYLGAVIVDTRGAGERELWGSDDKNFVREDQKDKVWSITIDGKWYKLNSEDPSRQTGPMYVEIYRDEEDKIWLYENGIFLGGPVVAKGLFDLTGIGHDGTGSSQWDDGSCEFIILKDQTQEDIEMVRSYIKEKWDMIKDAPSMVVDSKEVEKLEHIIINQGFVTYKAIAGLSDKEKVYEYTSLLLDSCRNLLDKDEITEQHLYKLRTVTLNQGKILSESLDRLEEASTGSTDKEKVQSYVSTVILSIDRILNPPTYPLYGADESVDFTYYPNGDWDLMSGNRLKDCHFDNSRGVGVSHYGKEGICRNVVIENCLLTNAWRWLFRSYRMQQDIALKNCTFRDVDEEHGIYWNMAGLGTDFSGNHEDVIAFQLNNCLFENIGSQAIQIVYRGPETEDPEEDGTRGGMILCEDVLVRNTGLPRGTRASFAYSFKGSNNPVTLRRCILDNTMHTHRSRGCVLVQNPDNVVIEDCSFQAVATEQPVGKFDDCESVTITNTHFESLPIDDGYDGQNWLQFTNCKKISISGCTGKTEIIVNGEKVGPVSDGYEL